MNRTMKRWLCLVGCASLLIACSKQPSKPSKKEEETLQAIQESVGNGKTFALGNDVYYDSKGIVKYRMIEGFEPTDENDTFQDKDGNTIKIDVDYIRDVEDIKNINDLKHIYFEYDYNSDNHIKTALSANGDFILMKTEKGYDLITRRELKIPADVPNLILGIVIKLELAKPMDIGDMLLQLNKDLKAVQ